MSVDNDETTHKLFQQTDRMLAEVTRLRLKNQRLRIALQRAVDLYGKPGGPWNVPSEPGSWIAQAREALKGEG